MRKKKLISETQLLLLLSYKVDKVDGKGLSTHDFDDAAKNLLSTLSRELDEKVDKVSGKQLSTNDFSNAYKTKLDGIESGAQANVVEEIRVNNNPLTTTGKAVNIDLSAYVQLAYLETNYYTKTEIDSSLSSKENVSNKVTSLSNNSTHTEYPSAKATYNAIKEAVSNVYKFQGTMTVSQLNALVKDASMHGFVYNVSDSGDLQWFDGTIVQSMSVIAGDNVAIVWDVQNNTYSWDKLAGTFTVDLTNYASLSGNNAFTGNNAHSGTETFSGGVRFTYDETKYSTFYVAANKVLYLRIGGTDYFAFSETGLGVNGNIVPFVTNRNTVGTRNLRYADAYLIDIDFSGVMNPNTNGYGLVAPDTSGFTANKEIATTDQALNVINASDIVNNTLTQEQYDLITNGKPTLIKGTILGYTNPLIVSLENFTSTLRGFMFTGRTLRGIMITVSTRTLSDGGMDLRFDKVNMINGKIIPPYPTSNANPQIPMIAPNGGALYWSDMPTVPQAEPIDIEILEMKIIQDGVAFDENAPLIRCRYDFVDNSDVSERNDPKFAYLHIKSSFIDDYAEQQIREGNFIIRFDYPTFYNAHSHKMKGNGRYSFVKNLYMGDSGSYLDIAEDIERSFLYIEPNDIKTDNRGRKFIYKKIPIVNVLNHLWRFTDEGGEADEPRDDYFDYDNGDLDQIRVGGAVQTHSDTFINGGPSRLRDSGTVKYGYSDFSQTMHNGEVRPYATYQSPNKDAMLLHYWAPFMISHAASFSTIFTRHKTSRGQPINLLMNGSINKNEKFASEAVVKPRFAILDPDYDIVEEGSMFVKKYPQYNKRLYCYPAQLFDSLINHEDEDFDVVIFRFGISK